MSKYSFFCAYSIEEEVSRIATNINCFIFIGSESCNIGSCADRFTLYTDTGAVWLLVVYLLAGLQFLYNDFTIAGSYKGINVGESLYTGSQR